MFYEKDQTVFICMHVCAFVSFPYCLCRKKKWQYEWDGAEQCHFLGGLEMEQEQEPGKMA